MLMPELFLAYPHRGISFWGNYFPAVVPYSLGLLISIVCLLWAAYIMPDYPERISVMRRLLFAIAFGLAEVLLTPEQASTVFLLGAHFGCGLPFHIGSHWHGVDYAARRKNGF